MNPHLKLAYDHGVQKALEDAGLTKLSERYNSISTDSYGEQIKGWENADESLLKNPVDGYYHAINIEKSRPWFGNALLPSEVASFRDALRKIKGIALAPRTEGEQWVEWGHPRGTDEERDAYFSQIDAAVKQITGR